MPPYDPHARRHHPQPGELDLFLANRDIARSVSQNYFLPGGDEDDVLQECEIGLLVACRDYDGSSDFRSYAYAVTRQWIQVRVSAARRLKHQVLTDAGRVTRDEDDELVPILDVVGDPVSVERLVSARDDIRRMADAMASLTEVERDAVYKVANGIPYSGDKRVDNAIQRARRKLSEAA